MEVRDMMAESMCLRVYVCWVEEILNNFLGL